MNRAKTAEFLADCLRHIPTQPDEVKVVIGGLTRIANGGEWPEDEAKAAADAAANAAYWAAARAADWAAAAAYAASRAAFWAESTSPSPTKTAFWATNSAANTAVWAAEAHPDPAKERARQAKVREKLGLNTKQEAK